MIRPRYDEIYNVVSTDTFDQQWNEGVERGWIDLVVRPKDFVSLRNQVLGSRPWIGPQVPGMPANYRFIRFPRHIGVAPNLEIRYSIVEDDLTVRLEEIREISSFGM